MLKDLTAEQREHLQGVFKACSGIHEEATHIDENFKYPITKYYNLKYQKNKILKITQEGTQYFLGVRGNWCDAEELRVKTDNYFEIPTDFCRVTGAVLSDENVQSLFPDFSFKLSCGDRPEVRQWLKDNGCNWSNGQCIKTNVCSYKEGCGVIYVKPSEDSCYVDTLAPENFIHIEPTIKVKVVGYTLTESSKYHKQKLDKITELRNNIEDIQKQIEELEKDLRGN